MDSIGDQTGRWHRFFAWAVVLILSLGQSAVMAAPQPRYALVIGNASYADAPLKNPVNDARAMAAKLRELGFEVTLFENLKLRQMRTALARFGQKLTKAPDSAAVFYFAGHGIQSRGDNYLMPVDAATGSEATARAIALKLDDVLEEIEYRGKGVNLVLLDACRNNPFEPQVRGGSRGLARVNAARGTLVSYATAPGKVAADGEGNNGVYTAALLEALSQPGLDEDDLFERVASRVEQRTGGQQIPWTHANIRGDFVFNAPVTVQVEQAAPGATDSETVFWQSVEDSDNAALYEAYLRQWPGGVYAPIAKVKLGVLNAPTAVASASPAPSAAPTQSLGGQPPVAALGALTVRSNVSGDTVYINDASYGATGPRALQLGKGTYLVRVVKPGFEAPPQQLTLKAGERRTLRFRLQRTGPSRAEVAAADPEPAPVQRVEPPTRSNKFAASPPAPAASAGASQDSAMVTLARMLLSKKPERSEADLLRLARDAMDEFAADARRIAAEPNVNLADRVGEFKNLLGYVVDFPMMGKLVVGSYRSTMTIDQWEDFIRLYKSLLLSGDYSFSSVEQWDGSVDIEGLHRDGQDFVANFSITSSKGATLKLGFRVRKSDTGGLPYKVIDVKASGVSLIRTQRSEFQSILKSQGVDGLNRILSNKLEQRKTRG